MQIQKFISEDPETIILQQIFNEQHAAAMFEEKLQLKPNFHRVHFHNVGVKIMKDALQKFQEQNITFIKIQYNWNEIMVMPKLVCYDKNTWKTLQQLANWTREWSQLFKNCYSLGELDIKYTCSYADDQFVKAFLEGIAALPNIQKVSIDFSSKNNNCQNMLQAFKKAQIFPSFSYKFTKIQK